MKAKRIHGSKPKPAKPDGSSLFVFSALADLKLCYYLS
jgi:hypothetical protein